MFALLRPLFRSGRRHIFEMRCDQRFDFEPLRLGTGCHARRPQMRFRMGHGGRHRIRQGAFARACATSDGTASEADVDATAFARALVILGRMHLHLFLFRLRVRVAPHALLARKRVLRRRVERPPAFFVKNSSLILHLRGRELSRTGRFFAARSKAGARAKMKKTPRCAMHWGVVDSEAFRRAAGCGRQACPSFFRRAPDSEACLPFRTALSRMLTSFPERRRPGPERRPA